MIPLVGEAMHPFTSEFPGGGEGNSRRVTQLKAYKLASTNVACAFNRFRETCIFWDDVPRYPNVNQFGQIEGLSGRGVGSI